MIKILIRTLNPDNSRCNLITYQNSFKSLFRFQSRYSFELINTRLDTCKKMYELLKIIISFYGEKNLCVIKFKFLAYK